MANDQELKDLEAMMSAMAGADQAGVEIGMGDEIDPEEFMPDLDEIDETLEMIPSKSDEEEGSDVVDDYKVARSHLHWLMKVNQTMIVNNARLAKTTTHPKNFEAHDKMVQTQLRLATAVVEMSGKLSEGKLKSRAASTTQVFEEEREEKVINGDNPVKIERRASQGALWDAIRFNKEQVEEGKPSMSNEKINELALMLDEKRASEKEEGGE